MRKLVVFGLFTLISSCIFANLPKEQKVCIYCPLDTCAYVAVAKNETTGESIQVTAGNVGALKVGPNDVVYLQALAGDPIPVDPNNGLYVIGSLPGQWPLYSTITVTGTTLDTHASSPEPGVCE